jgi:hypothetical protein
VESQVTLHEIADRNDMAIKASHETTKDQADHHETTKVPYVHDKPTKTKAIFGLSMTEASLTIEPHNNAPTTG